ncbi:S9 family peptidase [Pseudonocardia sp. KRD291]|uniref:alpha/beta hydrolase family protein n=1 Tax=Pseudonocardia sp. KRD291 TaxID=2792007 RepID=UPI001C4A3139|nr:prolyl oligopeptidase family serine peptidase [Pseudonocardia sp. KRD291]MBW0103110.1 alpha/beta hydrolase [Pseudonocardia sp. KRD291]
MSVSSTRVAAVRGTASAAAVTGTVAGAALGIGWHYSSVLIDPRSRSGFPERVLSTTDGSVALARSRLCAQPGVWGLRWDSGPGRDGGLAVLGPVLEQGRGRVVREHLGGPRPPVGPAVIDAGPFDPDPAARGPAFAEVVIDTPLGPAPAWDVPPARGREFGATWAIHVHGRGGSRREALRVLPALHDLGLHQLVISYRNDGTAPDGPDGRSHLGDTEWEDLDAAVGHALERGAEEIVLVGWSMGAAVSGAFLDRSPRAAHVAAVVWDAPLLDWRATLRRQAANRYLPPPLAGVASRLTTRRIGIDFDRFDLARRPPAVRPPTMVVHSDADSAVPVSVSRGFVAAAPGLGWPVRYLEVAGVEHTGSWNADPQVYEDAVTGFLRDTLGAG